MLRYGQMTPRMINLRFSQMNLRMKIFTGFGALLLLLIFSSLINTWNQAQNGVMVNQYIENEHRITLAEQLLYYSRTANANGANEILSPYPSVQKQYDNAFNQNVGKANSLLQQLKGMTQSSADVALLQGFLNGWEDFQSITNSALGFFDQGKVKNAGVIYSQVTFEELTHALNAYSNHQIANNQSLLADMNALRTRSNVINLVFTVMALFIGIWVAWLVSARISSAVFNLQKYAKKIASGELTQFDSQLTNDKDELGNLASSLSEMASQLNQVIVGVKQAATEVTTASIDLNENAEFASDSVRGMAESLKELADGAKVQLSNHSQSASSMDEIAQGLNEVAELSLQLAIIAAQSEAASEKGQTRIKQAYDQMGVINQEVEKTSQHVETLNQQSQRIAEMISVITDIAEQTNLLSLNAAIEAARAGEQGRGFAVVAEEVRKLAAISRRSAEEITKIVQEIRLQTEAQVQDMKLVAKESHTGLAVMNEAEQDFQELLHAARRNLEHVQDFQRIIVEMNEAGGVVAESLKESREISTKFYENTQTIFDAIGNQESTVTNVHMEAQNLSASAQHLLALIERFHSDNEEVVKKPTSFEVISNQESTDVNVHEEPEISSVSA